VENTKESVTKESFVTVVEVTEKKVRRDRVGHINLVVPIAHIWYFRSLPKKIGYILGLPSKKLDMIIYYERYVVIQAGIAKMVKVNQFKD
jgi:DNA-directed RNA polymerase subunit beta'